MDQPALLPAGHVVAGRYRIEQVLGQGGFGAVYRATQLAGGREVALKMILPEMLADDVGLLRFQREAELAQRLTHPNTVRIFDHGRAEDGSPFIVFELLRGRPLGEVIRSSGPLAPARVLRIASQALKALMDAHAQGVIHRDIKPSNLMLCDFQGEPDFVKVLDFGIARIAKPEGRTTEGLTRQGQMIGTPSYMAPEQVTGAAVGPATDLYALGLVMSEALSGRVVFGEGSGFQVCMAQVSAAPVPLPPEVLGSPLGPVIERATRKAVAERFGSAGELLAALEASMRSAGAVAAPATVQIAATRAAVPAIAFAAPAPYAPIGFAPAPAVTPPARSRGWMLAMLVGGIAIGATIATLVAVRVSGNAGGAEVTPTVVVPVPPTPAVQPPKEPIGPVTKPPSQPVPPSPPPTITIPSQPGPTPVKPSPTPAPTQPSTKPPPCGCAPGDLQCAMKCSASKKTKD